MQKTRIEWVKNPDGTQGYAWNPIKGICPVGCWYCYARKMYKRFGFGWGDFLRFEYKTLDAPMPKKPSKIFVCSTMEMFHTEIKVSWRNCIFDIIKRHPQHTFQILTKFPQNIDRSMPSNVWLGVTVTGENASNDLKNLSKIQNVKAKIKFISFEPMLGRLYWDIPFRSIDWVIIGRLTGYGKKYNPERGWIEKQVRQASYYKIPIFLKDNLRDIWGEELIQEFPE